MRSSIVPAMLLVVGSPVLAQPAQILQPAQSRVADPVRSRTELSADNPTTMQLRVQIQELESKVDELTSLMQSQSATLASLQTSLTEFRQVSGDQYRKLRMTGFLDCYQTAANSTWGYGDGDVAVRHCTGELGPADKVPY